MVVKSALPRKRNKCQDIQDLEFSIGRILAIRKEHSK